MFNCVKYMLRKTHSQAGFTLIELSIVLVIIGLIVGGILTGQSLIHTAELKNQMKQMSDYQVAFNTFQVKYNCIPGDCANATQFFGTTDSFGNTINNGNGNGLIDTNSGTSYDNGASWSGSTEMGGAFQQLAMAGLIAFKPKTPSSYVLGSGVAISALNSATGFFLSASYSFLQLHMEEIL